MRGPACATGFSSEVMEPLLRARSSALVVPYAIAAMEAEAQPFITKLDLKVDEPPRSVR